MHKVLTVNRNSKMLLFSENKQITVTKKGFDEKITQWSDT